ncbi:putative dpy-30 domain-containing protein [Rosellinia necatrix]|uniref:Putative dpy-30 domain-containing protein n=1 Tax=Rosellinia necatrix TaxID=77044 RepID=A0A1W2TDH6_ROSNE|nr:putative dpy-30 domain-containing protein [Rosellinia necatrix]
MADEIPQTPVPVPTYGQPQSAAPPVIAQSQPSDPSTGSETHTIAPTTEPTNKDITMADVSSADQAPSPAPAATSTNVPSPAPARTGTPLRTNGPENTSRATSQHPDPAFTMPDAAPAHGAPVRQYLNSKVTAHLLEGMKQLAKNQPKDPLRVLGEFLIERSKEFET